MMNEKLYQLVNERRAEEFKKAVAETENFDINDFVDSHFMTWGVDDIVFIDKIFEIDPNSLPHLHEDIYRINPNVLDLLLDMGAKLSAEELDNLLAIANEEIIVVLMHHYPSAIDEDRVFGWAAMGRKDLLEVYLNLGGDSEIRDEAGRSLADVWYFHNGDEDDEMLDTFSFHGIDVNPETEMLDEATTLAGILGDKLNDAKSAEEVNTAKFKRDLAKALAVMKQGVADMEKAKPRFK
jgi:hypothetical protein